MHFTRIGLSYSIFVFIFLYKNFNQLVLAMDFDATDYSFRSHLALIVITAADYFAEHDSVNETAIQHCAAHSSHKT